MARIDAKSGRSAGSSCRHLLITLARSGGKLSVTSGLRPPNPTSRITWAVIVSAYGGLEHAQISERTIPNDHCTVWSDVLAAQAPRSSSGGNQRTFSSALLTIRLGSRYSDSPGCLSISGGGSPPRVATIRFSEVKMGRTPASLRYCSAVTRSLHHDATRDGDSSRACLFRSRLFSLHDASGGNSSDSSMSESDAPGTASSTPQNDPRHHASPIMDTTVGHWIDSSSADASCSRFDEKTSQSVKWITSTFLRRYRPE
mmetsp:Transcript_19882/g.59424  ORF Transcript_19882/g.59424 Transcript_19882/m.59424 type:complete len:257 (+) Transcript_19882:1249-2019(+)